MTIPDSIAYLSKKWELGNIRPLVEMSPTSNYAARAYSAPYKTDVVLKILIHDTKEPQALKLFNGNGCVKLLEYDAEYNGLLLENIMPGNTLSTLFPHDDARALEITAALIKKMQQADFSGHLHEFDTVEDWMAFLHTFQSKKIPQQLLEKAYELSQTLLSMPYKKTLLHGDLHHENILQCSDADQRNSDLSDVFFRAGSPGYTKTESWIIIDPKGVVGPVEFEVIRFMMNPIPALLQQSNHLEIIERRIEQLHKLFGFEKQRLRDWLFVQAVLSACWAEQGGGQEYCTYFLSFANIVEKNQI